MYEIVVDTQKLGWDADMTRQINEFLQDQEKRRGPLIHKPKISFEFAAIHDTNGTFVALSCKILLDEGRDRVY